MTKVATWTCPSCSCVWEQDEYQDLAIVVDNEPGSCDDCPECIKFVYSHRYGALISSAWKDEVLATIEIRSDYKCSCGKTWTVVDLHDIHSIGHARNICWQVLDVCPDCFNQSVPDNVTIKNKGVKQ